MSFILKCKPLRQILKNKLKKNLRIQTFSKSHPCFHLIPSGLMYQLVFRAQPQSSPISSLSPPPKKKYPLQCYSELILKLVVVPLKSYMVQFLNISLILHQEPSHCLNSSGRTLFTVPSARHTTKGNQPRSTRVAQLWNALPDEIRFAKSVSSLRCVIIILMIKRLASQLLSEWNNIVFNQLIVCSRASRSI